MRVPIILLTLCASIAAAAPSFDKPSIVKVDWSIRSLNALDIDGDGKKDLALLNNDESKIELLYQRKTSEAINNEKAPRNDRWQPVWSDAAFERESLVTGLTMYNLQPGDFNNDGRIDLAVTAKQKPLSIYYAQKEGGWSKPEVIDGFEALGWSGVSVAGDFNADGRADLGLLVKNKLMLFLQNERGQLDPPQPLILTGENPHDLQLVQMNEDKLPDLLYMVNDKRFPIRLRLSESSGYGPELLFSARMGTSHIALLEDSFALIEEGTRLVKEFVIEPANQKRVALKDFRPLVYAASEYSGSNASYAQADFDGDGNKDIIIGDEQGARLWLYKGSAGGSFLSPVEFPSLTGVSRLAAGVFSSNNAPVLLVMSREEEMLGVSTLNEKGRLSFPEMVDIEGQPLDMIAEDFTGSFELELLLLEKRDRDYVVTLRSGKPGSTDWSILTELELEDIRRDPDLLYPVDINQDGRLDFMLLTAREAARIFIQTEEGDFTEAAQDSNVRKSLLENIEPKDLGTGDADGDGTAEVLVSGKGFVRAVRLSDEEKLTIVDQFNTRTSETIPSVPLMVDIMDDGRAELLYLAGGKLEVLGQDKKNVMRFVSSVEVGDFSPLHAAVHTNDAGGSVELRYFGKGSFWRIPLSGETWQLEYLSSYETELEGINPSVVGAANFEGGGAELVLIDGIQNLMEIIRRDGTEEWKSVLHFTVFEENMHYQGRKGATMEPREIILEDVTGDGKQDIVLLVHDRLLIYPQL